MSLTDNIGGNCQSTGDGSLVDGCVQPAGRSALSSPAASDAGSLPEDLLTFLLALLTFAHTRRCLVLDRIYTYDTSALSPLITAFPLPLQTHTSGTSYHYDYNTNPCIYAETGDSTLSSFNYDTPPCTFSATFEVTSSNAPTPTAGYRYAATSRHYYGYRLYIPEIGIWASRDPINELGFYLLRTGQQVFKTRNVDSPPTPRTVVEAALQLIQELGLVGREEINAFLQGQGGLNLYCLTRNNPLNIWDYLGLAPFCICVRAGDDHAWIHVKDLANGEVHTYGRWKHGYGRPAVSKSGVIKDMETRRTWGASRCVKVDAFTPTINEGYAVYDNNCATYARDEWKRITGEDLDIDEVGPFGWDSPSTLKDSINSANDGKKKSDNCCGEETKK